MTNTTHPFEKAGLGRAPFRCTAVTQNWYSAGPGHKQPGGSCNYCGTGIAYEYHVEGADGSKFKVGCDCIWKIYGGDKRMADAEVGGFREARKQLTRQKREAGRAARLAERRAVWEAERVKRYADFSTAEPVVCGILSRLLQDADPEAPSNFMIDMARAVQRYGSLTAGQLAAVKGSIERDAKREADKAASEFVAAPGKRIHGEFEVIMYRQFVSSYGWPRKTITWTLMRMNGRDVVSYKGNYIGEVGDKFKAKFTVKEHETYNGTRQTKLARPAIETEETEQTA